MLSTMTTLSNSTTSQELVLPAPPFNQIDKTFSIFSCFGWQIQMMGDLGRGYYTQDIDYMWHMRSKKISLRFDSISHLKFWISIDSNGNVIGEGYGPYGIQSCYYIIDNGKTNTVHNFIIRDLNNKNFELDLIFVNPYPNL